VLKADAAIKLWLRVTHIFKTSPRASVLVVLARRRRRGQYFTCQ